MVEFFNKLELILKWRVIAVLPADRGKNKIAFYERFFKMEKAKNIVISSVLGLTTFAIVASFCDAISNVEAVGILGVSFIALVALSKLPTPKANS